MHVVDIINSILLLVIDIYIYIYIYIYMQIINMNKHYYYEFSENALAYILHCLSNIMICHVNVQYPICTTYYTTYRY